jgi:hypothetical protein
MPTLTQNLAAFAIAGMLSAGMMVGDLAAEDRELVDPTVATEQYKPLHDCAGLNTCKGLGGCGVDAKKKAILAKKAGISVKDAGPVHECAGLNECKGLGGCKVSAEKFVKLLIKQAEKEGYKAIHDCSGMNVCKGLGGCKVTAEDQAKFAAKRGIDVSHAGAPHACAGLNACKGLGGCSVDEKKLAKLKKKLKATLE